MQRKVIQIANSTHLISLPKKWADKYGVKKGDSLTINEKGDKIEITTSEVSKSEAYSIDMDDFGALTARYIHALYKRGADLVEIKFSKPEMLTHIQGAIGKEAVGFEIVDQGENFCTIRHVSGELEDFDAVLRRTFLMLISMCERCEQALKKKAYDQLVSAAFLEEANNRFTTSCRRFLNKRGYKDTRLSGPLYYIIEDLENLADQFKYLCNDITKAKEKVKISDEAVAYFSKLHEMLRSYYEAFYSDDPKNLAKLSSTRKTIVTDVKNHLMSSTGLDALLYHYIMVISQKIFCLIGPQLIALASSSEVKS